MSIPPLPLRSWPRYSSRPFPAYRFIPGRHPHPRRDPEGHSFGQPEPRPPACDPDRWVECEAYLYGVDLYNDGYWWECHEMFEGLWRAAGFETTPGRFFRALIQVAAANLKRSVGALRAARTLSDHGLTRLATLPPRYMGLDIVAFSKAVRRSFGDEPAMPAVIRLAVPDRTEGATGASRG